MTNILIVDDTDVDLILMERLLESPDFTIVTAGDGKQALEKLSAWPIDLILTDLQMPKMNGLELVRELRKQQSTVPVILTTGKGSEDIASEALQAGASSYIPKSKLNLMLSSTVSSVLEMLSTDRDFRRLNKFSELAKFRFELSCDPTLLPDLVDFFQRQLQMLTPLDRIDRLRIAMALDQALSNSLYRGNLEISSDVKVNSRDFSSSDEVEERLNSIEYSSRKIKVGVEIRSSCFRVVIEDDGPGFDTEAVGGWDDSSHRGIILMNAFMDSVEYNDVGNRVEMRFNFEDEAEADQIADDEAGESGATLIYRTTGQEIDLARRKIVIGSKSGCHIKLKSETVAPIHCMLKLHNHEWVIVVLTKTHSTLLNGKEFKSTRLRTGDVIKIGSKEFDFKV